MTIFFVNAPTSNDIIAENGRILSVHEYSVAIFVKKLYHVHELFFIFPSDALYSGDLNNRLVRYSNG